MDLTGLRALVRSINFATPGVPATVGGVSTRAIWLTPTTENPPAGNDFTRAEPRRSLALRRDEVPTIPRGTVIYVTEPTQSTPRSWRVDSVEAVQSDHHRVVVVPHRDPLLDEVYGSWPLDEEAGTRYHVLGTAPDLLETGGAVGWAEGKFGLAALGPSEAGVAGLYAPISLAAADGLTLAFWFYWPMWSSGNVKSMLALDTSLGSGPIGLPCIAVARFFDSDFLEVGFVWGAGGPGETAFLPLPRLGNFDQDAWHLCLITYDATTGKLTGMVDEGCEADAQEWNGGPLPAYKLSVTIPSVDLAVANASVFSDIRMFLIWGGVSFEGRLDAVKLWPRALTPEECGRVAGLA